MRRIQSIATRNIVVQLIHVTWDKSGRGGRAAECRNRIPLALTLPEQLGSDIGRHFFVHESHWSHTNVFANEVNGAVRKLNASEGFQYRCVSVRVTDTGAQLDWTWRESEGIPPRMVWDDNGNTSPASHRVDIPINEWMRARWNARFTCVDTGTWWYESVVANVGVISDANIPADFFTRSQPMDEYLQMAHLR
ncbi:hypothetical protein AB1L30_01090 [Bremerella sp. JC817]|uniref:hypothetical protein n=1 Tax=Bremerella sp. JC817 TaxID=3231756 RepID=UPI0034584586